MANNVSPLAGQLRNVGFYFFGQYLGEVRVKVEEHGVDIHAAKGKLLDFYRMFRDEERTVRLLSKHCTSVIY